jgi:hypothetical protein
MANGLDELQHIANAIGDEVVDSTQKIKAVSAKTAKVTETVQTQNRRVEFQLLCRLFWVFHRRHQQVEKVLKK